MTRLRLLLALILIAGLIGDRPRTVNASPNAGTPHAAEPADDKTPIPVVLDEFSFGGNSGRYRITNVNKSPLVAYTVIGGKPSGQPWTHVDDFRAAGEPPLALGQSHLGDDIWNQFEYPRGMRVIAAIFVDGTAMGDPHWIGEIMDGRREQIFTYASTARAICELARQHQAVPAILAALDSKKGDYVHLSADKRYVNRISGDAYKTMTDTLQKNAAAGTVPAARAALALALDRSQKLLSDPVKGPDGKLILAGVSGPAACPLQ
jgi:hypothetical protein